jgi:hypothetical protein
MPNEHSETGDKYVSRSLHELGPLFLLQGAADPEHPIKQPGTPHPTQVDLHKFEETRWIKTGRAATCRGQSVTKLKGNSFIYEICRPFSECRRRKYENGQSKWLSAPK